jgi:capsular polysaccharide biosynthesis protein
MGNTFFLISSLITRKRFQSSVRRYLLSNLEDDLAVAREMLDKLWMPDKKTRKFKQQIVITGWFSKSNKGKLNAKNLEILNPSYRVRVSRRIRRDLFAHRKAYGYFSSFRIVFRQRNFDEVFDKPVNFIIGNESGGFEYLRASNSNAKRSMGALLLQAPKRASKALGFIDSVSGISDLSELELEDLVLNCTDELLAFANTDKSRFNFISAIEILQFNGRDEQADKFAFIGDVPDYKYKLSQEVSIRRHFLPTKISGRGNQRISMKKLGNGVVESQVTGEAISSPGKGWLDLRDVDLLSGALVLNDGTLENYEHAADPTWDFVSGLWQIQFGSVGRKDCALIKTSNKQGLPLGESILIGGRNDSNYYHFMVEYLPRLLTIPDSVSKSVPVLISKAVPKSGKQALERLTNRKIIEIDPGKKYLVRRLHVSAPVAQVLDTTKVPWADGVFLDFKALRNFRRKILSLLDVSELPVRKIYLRRDSGHRNLANGQLLENLASNMGFEVIDVIGMSWEEQVRLFASAKVVVGAGGAVMANYIFLPKGSKVISLTSEYLSDFSLPAYMASVAGASFTYITGKTILTGNSLRNSQQLMHSGFRIRKSTFKKVINDTRVGLTSEE